ncbi:MAG: glycosyltransferase family 2 protein [Candidatus Saccharimonadales bacterium]
MKTAIVIPNWNGADMIAACLESLQKQTLKAKIIIVDNGSVDESVQIIERQFPEVILIKLAKNTGFAGGVNTGIKYALDHDFEAIALFNNDAVAQPDWLKELVAQMGKTPKTGITTGKLMRSDKRHIDSTGDFYSTWGISFPRGRNQADTGQYELVESVFGASGGASLYRATMLQEIGLFDERFFAYFEDVDISFRAQLAGWDIIYTPKAVAYHHVGATSSKLGDFTRYHSIKNFLILYTKNMPASLYWKYLPYFLYQFGRTTARSIIDLKPQVWLKSVAVFIGLLPSILRDRRVIQKGRRRSASQVNGLLHVGRPPKIPQL